MSSSTRLHAWIAVVAVAAIAGCSGNVSIGGSEGGEDPNAPGNKNGDPPSFVDPEGNPPSMASCGDGSCDPPESCGSCSQDCGGCPPPNPGCGNNVCTPNESCADCPEDCGACPCAHPACSVGEALDATCDPCVAQICAVDPFCCDAFWDGLCVSEVGSVCGTPCAASCGDGLCDPASESCSTCSQDCGACPVCGDGLCDWTEDCGTCSADCGACPVCGDNVCDWTEDCSTCSADCGACPSCGDAQCDPGETCSGCPGDCGACVCHDECAVGDALAETCSPCVAQICAVDPFCCTAFWDGLCVSEVGSVCGTPCAASCGDGLCDVGEDCNSCANDCGACPTCGDNICDSGEDCTTCAGDCGACPVCGDSVCDWTEDCTTCAADCGACAGCGDGTCDFFEDCSTCPADCGGCGACPANDLGSAVPQTTSGNTSGGANALTASCGASNAPEVTYSFTAPAAGSYEFNTFGSAYDTVLEVRDATCQGASLGCNDDKNGLQSQVIVTLAAGQTVVVVVDGFATSQGAFTLNVL